MAIVLSGEPSSNWLPFMIAIGTPLGGNLGVEHHLELLQLLHDAKANDDIYEKR